MEIIQNILKVLGSVFSVLAALYGFLLWREKRRRETLLKERLSVEQAQVFAAPQRGVLEAWRLFDFQRDVRIADIYVQEILHVVDPSKEKSKVLMPPTPEEDIRRQLSEGHDPEKRLVVIEGLAGSGKSSLLRSWTLKSLESLASRGSSHAALAAIPVYLALSHLPSEPAEDGNITTNDLAICFRRAIPGLTEALARLPFERIEQIRKRLQAIPNRKPLLFRWTTRVVNNKVLRFLLSPLKSLIQRLRKGRLGCAPEWIILCDAVDELVEHRRADFLRWIQALPPSVSVVIASRPNVLQVANFVRSQHYRICDFNDKQIEQLTKRWFVENPPLAELLLRQIQSGKSLRQLAGSPLLLTCLCIDVEIRDEASFPEQLLESDLLWRIVEVILDKWDATKACRAADERLINLGMHFLSSLALEHPSHEPIPYKSLVARLHATAAKMGVSPTEENAFLQRITSGTQLLQGTPKDGFIFKHAVFFDFFLAEGIKRVHLKPSTMG